MKKLILPTVCFAVLSTPAFEKVIHAAENDTPITEVGQIHVENKYVKVDSGSNLNVRATASSTAPVLTKLVYGSKVMVYSEESGWAKVKANGKEGYVSTKYLTTSEPSEASTPSTPKIQSAPAPVSAPAAKPTTTTKYVQVEGGSNLNLRSSASDDRFGVDEINHWDKSDRLFGGEWMGEDKSERKRRICEHEISYYK